jgi:septin family protein
MDTKQSRRRFADLQFRVLVIGRANAGKTSILQRVCETTESPTIYRGKEKFELKPTMERGEHRIDDALVFSNHKGYVFHDSQGIEAGDEEKLEILKEFIQRKCREKRLRDKLHAIWFVLLLSRLRQLTIAF